MGHDIRGTICKSKCDKYFPITAVKCSNNLVCCYDSDIVKPMEIEMNENAN